MEHREPSPSAATDFFLASLLDRPVIDPRGREVGRLEDLVMVPGPRHPEVSRLVIRSGRRRWSVPWQDVSLFTPYVISVAGNGGEREPFEPREGEVLIRRDLMDRQIVDVNGARVLRVNDLRLGRTAGALCVLSVDVGFRGLLRRLGYERFAEALARAVRARVPHQEIGWEFVQPLDENASRLSLTVAREQLSDLHPADLADILAQIPSQEAESVLSSIDPEVAGEALHEMDPALGSRVLSELDSELATDILEEMSPDEAADVLGELPEEKAQELLERMDREDARDIMELLAHEEDTAGGLMNSEFVSLSPSLSVGEALAHVRLVAPDVDNITYAYVLDAEERPLGVVSLRKLLVTPPDHPLEEVVRGNLKTVGLDGTPSQILELIARYDLVAVPVIDPEGRMAGIVTVDDVLDLFLPHHLRRRRHV